MLVLANERFSLCTLSQTALDHDINIQTHHACTLKVQKIGYNITQQDAK